LLVPKIQKLRVDHSTSSSTTAGFNAGFNIGTDSSGHDNSGHDNSGHDNSGLKPAVKYPEAES